jgi:hypothetical protein
MPLSDACVPAEAKVGAAVVAREPAGNPSRGWVGLVGKTRPFIAGFDWLWLFVAIDCFAHGRATGINGLSVACEPLRDSVPSPLRFVPSRLCLGMILK